MKKVDKQKKKKLTLYLTSPDLMKKKVYIFLYSSCHFSPIFFVSFSFYFRFDEICEEKKKVKVD